MPRSLGSVFVNVQLSVKGVFKGIGFRRLVLITTTVNDSDLLNLFRMKLATSNHMERICCILPISITDN